MLVSFDIEKIEPLADGAPFGEVGPYERVIAKARGEVDPKPVSYTHLTLPTIYSV